MYDFVILSVYFFIYNSLKYKPFVMWFCDTDWWLLFIN